VYFWKVNRNYFNEKESHFTSRILNEVQERWPSILETVSVWSKSLTICRLWEPPHIKSFRFCSKRAWFEITICSFPKFVVSIEESNKIEVFISQRERESRQFGFKTCHSLELSPESNPTVLTKMKTQQIVTLFWFLCFVFHFQYSQADPPSGQLCSKLVAEDGSTYDLTPLVALGWDDCSFFYWIDFASSWLIDWKINFFDLDQRFMNREQTVDTFDPMWNMVHFLSIFVIYFSDVEWHEKFPQNAKFTFAICKNLTASCGFQSSSNPCGTPGKHKILFSFESFSFSFSFSISLSFSFSFSLFLSLSLFLYLSVFLSLYLRYLSNS
jgi:hypothetical protein